MGGFVIVLETQGEGNHLVQTYLVFGQGLFNMIDSVYVCTQYTPYTEESMGTLLSAQHILLKVPSAT